MHQLGEDGRVLAESLEDRGPHDSIREDAVIRSHRSSHLVVDLSDDLYHLRWYSDSRKYLPQKGAVDSVVSLLEINEAHEE